LGLADAVESHLRRTAAGADPPIAATLRRVGPEPALPPSESLALYRICQEAINNAVRHAGARKIAVELRATAEELTILVVDDGVGLDPDRPCGSGHGLSNIRYRADLVGAEVGWKAGETGGTAFRVRLPLARAAAVVSQTRAGGQGE